MARVIIPWSVVALLAATAGCRMCAHPYDYCGPMFTGECGSDCAWNSREGSILSETAGPMSSYEVTSPDAMVPIPDQMTGPVPGVQQAASPMRTVSSARVMTRSSQGVRR